MTANKATPEELDRLAEKAAMEIFGTDSRDDITGSDILAIRSAIDQALALAAADLIESQRNIEELVKRQAEDEGLWFNAKYATEAYLQDALRQLHKAVEALKDDSAVPVERQCES